MDSLPKKVGIIGCGNIFSIYGTMARRFPGAVTLAACADLDLTRARARAEEFGVPRALTVAELLADPGIDIVVNLTAPAAHAEVARAALLAGKSVYNEKPLATARADAAGLLALAAEKGRRVGCAPDTFLGAALQTCRRLLDSGVIGEPVAAAANMLCRGHENWHPAPEFFYQPGGGPMFDMGPYYLTALTSLLGPVRRVAGMARASFAERTIGSQPRRGQMVRVEVPTHVCAVLEFAAGPLATLTTSFDTWATRTPCIELHGAEGSLLVPDPNHFGGDIWLRLGTDTAWRPVPLEFPHAENNRGIGVADLATALARGRPHRASGELAFHVLDIMHAIHEAADSRAHVELRSTMMRPAAFPLGLTEGRVEG